MREWEYKKYLESVQSDLYRCQHEMGLTLGQSIDFSYGEHENRLLTFNDEYIFLMIALGRCFFESPNLVELDSSDDFISELGVVVSKVKLNDQSYFLASKLICKDFVRDLNLIVQKLEEIEKQSKEP
ncbi:MAG: hypothetical protein U5M23_05015 [Marinagarivorans sp.]|nr:hypothetical protein [Marinagarivorans sp.]